jgi:hypothetical protein
MKNVILGLLALCTLAANAQSDRYKSAMEKNLSQFDSSKTTQDFMTLANNFERIGDAEKTQWLPYYYAGLALTRVGWMDQKTDKDANSEKIKALCDKAEAIEKNSEILSIRNMAATQQMMVDPQTRWQSYGMEASTLLEKAKQLDPANPRLYYLQGMSIFNTPVQFGGGKDNAKPIFEKAVTLYKEEKPKPMYPNWGRQQAEEMLAKCQ